MPWGMDNPEPVAVLDDIAVGYGAVGLYRFPVQKGQSVRASTDPTRAPAGGHLPESQPVRIGSVNQDVRSAQGT